MFTSHRLAVKANMFIHKPRVKYFYVQVSCDIPQYFIFDTRSQFYMCYPQQQFNGQPFMHSPSELYYGGPPVATEQLNPRVVFIQVKIRKLNL